MSCGELLQRTEEILKAEAASFTRSNAGAGAGQGAEVMCLQRSKVLGLTEPLAGRVGYLSGEEGVGPVTSRGLYATEVVRPQWSF